MPRSFTTPVAALALVLSAVSLCAQPRQNLDFLTDLPDFEKLRTMLPSYLEGIARVRFAQRQVEAARIASPRDLAQRRTWLRSFITQSVGGFPESTPLHARVTGVLPRDGYRIEKIIFESQPGFFVTANLYVPTRGQPPYPAVLVALGHERGGKVNGDWQTLLVNLARRGYIGLAWDPLGQGERTQYYDPKTKQSLLGAHRYVIEHTMPGIQCLLVGDSVARYMIWDGIRALDYLLSRPEADARNVAVTGNSGGGNLTVYLAALDDRIRLAAPSCWLTSTSRLMETLGPQDAEQSLVPMIAAGVEQADFIEAFAPKPYLILAAIRDFFSIAGTRATFAEASAVYERAGSAGRLELFEADDGHGYTQPRREAFYRWLSKWVRGAEDTAPEIPVTSESEESLRCTRTGQVADSLQSETVYSLNRKRVPVRPTLPKEQLLERVRTRIAYAAPHGPLHIAKFGVQQRTGYRIAKLTYETEPGILIPALLFLPSTAHPGKPPVIYIHGRGKSADAAPGGDIEKLTLAGHTVLAIDPRGSGETAVLEPQDGQKYAGYFGDYSNTMKALLLGRTMVGMRAADIVRAIEVVAVETGVTPREVFAIGKESGGVPLLHAATLDERFRRVALQGALRSYREVVDSPLHRGIFDAVIPGVLHDYDLGDLVAALGPTRVRAFDTGSTNAALAFFAQP